MSSSSDKGQPPALPGSAGVLQRPSAAGNASLRRAPPHNALYIEMLRAIEGQKQRSPDGRVAASSDDWGTLSEVRDGIAEAKESASNILADSRTVHIINSAGERSLLVAVSRGFGPTVYLGRLIEQGVFKPEDLAVAERRNTTVGPEGATKMPINYARLPPDKVELLEFFAGKESVDVSAFAKPGSRDAFFVDFVDGIGYRYGLRASYLDGGSVTLTPYTDSPTPSREALERVSRGASDVQERHFPGQAVDLVDLGENRRNLRPAPAIVESEIPATRDSSRRNGLGKLPDRLDGRDR